MATGNLNLSFYDCGVRFYDRNDVSRRGCINLLTNEISNDDSWLNSAASENSVVNTTSAYSADSIMGHYGQVSREDFDLDVLRLRERLQMLRALKDK